MMRVASWLVTVAEGRAVSNMDDMEKALTECRRAQAENREMSDACARVIASMFHNGQFSTTYAFASTGYICEPTTERADAGQYATELYRELFPDYTKLSPAECLLADMMGTYLMVERIGKGRWGKVDGWADLWL